MSFFKSIDPSIEPWEAPNYVEAPTFSLYADQHGSYELPIDGWYWFDSKEDAFSFFGYVPPEPDQATLPLTPL